MSGEVLTFQGCDGEAQAGPFKSRHWRNAQVLQWEKLDRVPSLKRNRCPTPLEVTSVKLPLIVDIKNFLGVYVLTPFEQDLLRRLSDSLAEDEKETLSFQLSRFTTVRRFLDPSDDPKAHGFTNFYTTRLGKDVTSEKQIKRFDRLEAETQLARAAVTFEGGGIDVQFWLVRGVFFRIEYRSPQRVYYPPDDYLIGKVTVWPV